MAIIGIGVDLVEISRMEKAFSCSGIRLAKRLLSKYELFQYYKHNYPVRFLAKHFAVKEAAAKALGTGISKKLSFAQFEVHNDIKGKPTLKLFSYAEKLASLLGVTNIFVTLTDEQHYACAIVIFER